MSDMEQSTSEAGDVESRFEDRLAAILERMDGGEPAEAGDDAEFDDVATEEPAAAGADDGPEPTEDEEESAEDAPQTAPIAPPAPAKAPAPAAPQADPAKEAVLAQLQQGLLRKQAELDERAGRYEKLEAKREKLEKLEAALEMLEETDVVGALRAMGVNPMSVIEAMSKEGKNGAAPGSKARREEQARVDAIQKRIDDMERVAQQREREEAAAKQRTAAYAEIATLSAEDPLMSALGDTGRDSVVFWLHNEHQRTGVVHSFADGVKAASEQWRQMFHTVLENPKAREALLGSGDAGQADTTPTETSQARPKRTKQPKPSEAPAEAESAEDRFDRIWSEHAKRAQAGRRSRKQ